MISPVSGFNPKVTLRVSQQQILSGDGIQTEDYVGESEQDGAIEISPSPIPIHLISTDDNPPEDSSILATGTVLSCNGLDFEVGRFINNGGMSQVYEVTRDGEKYAAKFLNKNLVTTPFNGRFEKEIRLLEELNGNPHVIRLIASGSYNDQPFYIMEYADGGSLKDKKGTLTKKEMLLILAMLCPPLDDLHKKGIIHRDLKPSNILFRNGVPKLSDFGVAASTLELGVMSRHPSGGRLTNTNDILGTPCYMAPEQAKKALIVIREIQRAGNIDAAKRAFDRIRGLMSSPRIDFYSMGAMVYESLTGKLPIEYKQEGVEAYLDRIVNEPPVHILQHLPRLDRTFARRVMCSLNKNPELRFRDDEDKERALLWFKKQIERGIRTL